MARPALILALCFFQPSFGQSPSVAQRQEAISQMLDATRYQEAEQAARALLAELEASGGAGSADEARTLDLLVDSLLRLGRLTDPDTRRFAERSAQLHQTLFGPSHPSTWSPLLRLASLLVAPAERPRAYEIYTAVAASQESRLGADHPDLAETLNEFAVLLFQAGEFAKARTVTERALAMVEKTRGPRSLDAAVILTTLGFVLQSSGQHPGAKAAFERCLSVREQTLGAEHRLTIASMNNLATQLVRMQEFSAAIPLLERANVLREKLLGPDHPDNAIGVHNLAGAYHGAGDYPRARLLASRALALRERTIGPLHHFYANTLERLARIKYDLGDFAGARKDLERALPVYRKTLGPDHPQTLYAQKLYALILARLGETNLAFDLAIRTARAWIEHVRLTAQSEAERNALLYSEQAQEHSALELATSLLLDHPDLGAEALRRVWDLWIRSRVLLLDEAAARLRAVNQSSDPGLAALYGELAEARRQLAHLVFAGNRPAPEEMALATERKDRAERALAEKSSLVRRDFERSRRGFVDVAAALPKAAALIGYVRFLRFSADEPRPRPWMLAFSLRSGRQEPALVPLGPQSEIEAAVDLWRAQMRSEALAPGRSLRTESSVRAAGHSLRRKIWDPLPRDAREAEHAFVTLDGTLHLVNFAALPVGDSAYLVESGPLIHYLTAERDVVPSDSPTTGTGLLAFGNPSFSSVAASGRVTSPLLRSSPPACDNLRQLRFAPLPSTAAELREIAALWKHGSPVQRTGAAATEAEFYRQAPGKRVLHLATHGYFLPEACADAALAETPLLLSGLALAGANRRRLARQNKHDGILTAEEVAGLNLEGVEWVVLSGCDTGLGTIRTGEGVFGLRRAFQSAGAATVIMSLWPVEDDSARIWMKALYSHRLGHGLDTAASTRAASLALLGQRRARGLSTHPFHWAAFVAVGDWR